jgi:two-component system response regulator
MNGCSRILLVDDDAEDRLIIKDTFEELGYGTAIQFAVNGEDAISYLETCSTQPSLVILDLNMPKMNGTQTLRYLKDQPVLSTIPVIIFSTSLNPIEHDECLSLGAHSYVIKPTSYLQAIDVVKHFYTLCGELES